MSYAGTYGADETCSHGHYWRSCALCHTIGPQATSSQIAADQKRRERERQALIAAETQRREAYRQLTPDERKVAEALWSSYVGKGTLTLQAAVEARGLATSREIGRSRTICAQAKIAVAALGD